MQRQVLTEQALYYGDVDMPKDWDITTNKPSQLIFYVAHEYSLYFLRSEVFDLRNKLLK